MAWTFGGNTGNRFSIPASGSLGATGRTGMVFGWWLPTALTAGRGYWSVDTGLFARVATTTSEIELGTNNTTDGRWTTSGANVVLNEWRFVAFMLSTLNGTPSAAWRVWVGLELNAPTEVTVTLNTAPAGNFTGGSTFILGNVSNTGTVSWEGEISDCGVMTSAVNTSGCLQTNAFGAITQDEADRVRYRLVLPIWSGIPFPQEAWNMPLGNSFEAVYVPMGAGYVGSGTGVPSPRITNIANSSPTIISTSAGTLSKTLGGGPREFYANAASQPQRVRR